MKITEDSPRDEATPIWEPVSSEDRERVQQYENQFSLRSYKLRNGNRVRLTARQRIFVAEYLKDLDTIQAALRAGYSESSRLGGRANPMHNKGVREAIKLEIEYRARVSEVTAERVIAEYAKIAFGDARRVVEWNNGGLRLRDQSEVSPDDTAAISEITISKNGGTRLRMHDKVKALDSLAKHLGMFREHNKREVTLTLEQLVLQSYNANPALPAPSKATQPLALAETLVKHEYDKVYGTGNHVIDAVIGDGDDD